MVIIMRDHEVLRKALGCLLRFLCWCLWLRDIHSNISAYISPRCPWCCRYLQQKWNGAHFFLFCCFCSCKKTWETKGSGLSPEFSPLLSAMLSPHCFNITTHARTNTHRNHGEVIVWNKTYFLCLFNPLWRSENANTHTKTVLELLGHSVTA